MLNPHVRRSIIAQPGLLRNQATEPASTLGRFPSFRERLAKLTSGQDPKSQV